jgi:RimJ/RimL family protein N-acetyltransferase
MFPVRTERLLLRSFAPDDAPAFATYRSDPEVARFQSWTAPYPLTAAEELIAQMQGRRLMPPRAGEWNQIAIQTEATEPDAATLIGDCAFRLHPDDVRQASIGFTLARPYQHRGYATEAVRALLGELFIGMGLHRVTAVCDAENSPSQRVLKRVGMRREAHYVQNIFFKGGWGSEYAYAMLQAEWHESSR